MKRLFGRHSRSSPCGFDPDQMPLRGIRDLGDQGRNKTQGRL